jgi:hypothetical protein
MDIPTPLGPKQPVEVAKRIVSLFALTGLANEAEPDLLLAWLATTGSDSDLSASERRLFSMPLTTQEAIDLSWRQESLFALAWSAKIVETLDFPTDKCRLETVFGDIPPEVDVSRFLADLTLRDENELYLQCDMHYCLHWALRHPEVWGETPFLGRPTLDIVMERRHALEWIVGNAQTWDDVPLDT